MVCLRHTFAWVGDTPHYKCGVNKMLCLRHTWSAAVDCDSTLSMVLIGCCVFDTLGLVPRIGISKVENDILTNDTF